jgi:RNA polymerase sigma factor (sigma-70 family)
MPDVPQAGALRDRFEAMYEANYHRVLGYAMRRMSRDDAADVVAETFLVAWRRLAEVPDGEEARLWLFGTARRVLANQQRAGRRRIRLSERIRDELVQEVQPTSADSDLNLAAAALARLPSEQREVLTLVAWEGLDAGEIAQVCGCSRNAARIRIHRARRRFVRELNRLGGSVKQNPVGGHVSKAYE